MEASTETAVRRDSDRGAPETVGVPGAAGQGDALDGQAALDPRPGGEYRVEVRRQRRAGRVPGGRSASPPGLDLGLDRREHEPGAGRLDQDRGRARAGRRRDALRFTHSGLPDADATAKHAHGWDHTLHGLEIAARGDDPGRDTWLDEMK